MSSAIRRKLVEARPDAFLPDLVNHVGIPTTGRFEGEIPLPLKMTVSDHLNNAFGVHWQRYRNDSPYPELVKTVAHVAFEVDDLASALEGQRVIVEPNSPSPGVHIAFIEVNSAPIELMQIDHTVGLPRFGGHPK